MGRPIKARYFVKSGPKTPGDVVKYEGVTVAINANGTHYSQGATATFTAPQDAAGTPATLTLTITTTTGAISAATIGNVGSGYNIAPTVTVNTSTGVGIASTGSISGTTLYMTSTAGIYVGMKAIGAGINASSTYVTAVNSNQVSLSAANASTVSSVINFVDTGAGATFTVGLTPAENDTGTLAVTAYIPTGSSGVSSSIIKQEASKRYLVENAQGRGQCKLVSTDALTPGTMKLIATDWSGATYWVTKLTSRKARLVNRTNTSTSLVPLVNDGTVTTGRTGWTTGAATGTIVTIATY